MDVVSDVAAVVALVETTLKTIKFIQDLKDAKDDRAKIVRELEACAGILQKIVATVRQDAQSLPNLASLVVPNGPLDQYKKEIEHLVPQLTSTHGVLAITRTVKFTTNKKKIQDTITTLDRYKSTFLFCLNFDQTNLLLSLNNKPESTSGCRVPGTYHQSRPMVPFPLDSRRFFGREELLRRLTEGFKDRSCMALYGLGGVGKSQIATEYLRRLHQAEPDVAIFWVSVADRARFQRSYETIAIEIPESFQNAHDLLFKKQAPGEGQSAELDVLVLVKDWLSSHQSGKWLLILDNFDDPKILGNTKEDGESVLPYIPWSCDCHLIVTSRYQTVARSLVTREDSLIHVAPMSSQEAVLLLRASIPEDESTENDAVELANALDCLPLAIKQAVGYITATCTSIEDYLRLFSSDDSHQRRLLEKTYGDIGRDTHDDLQDSVILTWQISFDRIRIQRPAAADILSLMGCLDREDLLIDLLKGASIDEIEFQEDIGTLNHYSLINKNGDGISFSMHRLVQLTVRTWLMKQGTLDTWDSEALRSISKAFLAARPTDPEGEYSREALRLFYHYVFAFNNDVKRFNKKLMEWTIENSLQRSLMNHFLA